MEFINFRWYHKWIIPQIICLFIQIACFMRCHHFCLVVMAAYLSHPFHICHTRNWGEFIRKDCENAPFIGVVSCRVYNVYLIWVEFIFLSTVLEIEVFARLFVSRAGEFNFGIENPMNLMMNLIIKASGMTKAMRILWHWMYSVDPLEAFKINMVIKETTRARLRFTWL